MDTYTTTTGMLSYLHCITSLISFCSYSIYIYHWCCYYSILTITITMRRIVRRNCWMGLYPITHIPQWMDNGADIIGGCCSRTTPKHIQFISTDIIINRVRRVSFAASLIAFFLYFEDPLAIRKGGSVVIAISYCYSWDSIVVR